MTTIITRSEKINVIVDDLEQWLERDSYGFWDHVKELERKALGQMSNKELDEIYQESN